MTGYEGPLGKPVAFELPKEKQQSVRAAVAELAADQTTATDGPPAGSSRPSLANDALTCWCWIFEPVTGSSDYLLKDGRDNPTVGQFHLYMGEAYLQPLVEQFMKNSCDDQDARFCPSPLALRQFVEASDVRSIFYGWRIDLIKPID